jgi:hypothetical protein
MVAARFGCGATMNTITSLRTKGKNRSGYSGEEREEIGEHRFALLRPVGSSSDGRI